MYLSHIKELLSYRWLLILLIICQTGFGYMASYVLSERPPALRIAVFSDDESRVYAEFMDFLSEIPELSVVVTDTAAEAMEMARDQRVLAAILIPDDFSERISGSGADSVIFHPSPGTDAGLVAKEYIVAAVLKLRAEEQFRSEMTALGAYTPELEQDFTPVLTVSYEGPPLTYDPLSLTPGFGAPAIFVLLLTFYGASIMPGTDMKRLTARGSQALIRDFFSAAFALLSVWAVLTFICLGSGVLLYGKAPELNVILSFAALCVYCAAASGLIAALGLRRQAVWILLPWLILNMTAGGAIWGLALAPPFMKPFLPIAFFLEGCAAYTGSINSLWLSATAMSALSVFALLWRSRAISQRRRLA
jgi:hypothetical protein